MVTSPRLSKKKKNESSKPRSQQPITATQWKKRFVFFVIPDGS
jgi:hypothetical protein